MQKNNHQLTISEIIKCSRPISWVNTAVPYLVGYLVVMQSLNIPAIIGFIYFLFSYNLMLYGINDIYDYETDIKNPRKNSVEGAIMPKSSHNKLWFAIAITNIPFLIYFFVIGDLVSNAVLIATVFFTFSYSAKPLRFKEVPFLDSINSALHFVLPFVFGLTLANSKNYYWPIIIAFMLWGVASQAFGAIQDIKPDRAAKIHSIATYLGAMRTAKFSLTFYILCCFIVAFLYFPYGLLTSVFLSCYVLNVSFFLKFRSDAQSNQYRRGWKNFLWLNGLVGFFITQILLFAFDPFNLREYYALIFGLFLLGFFMLQLGLTVYNLRTFSRPKTKKLTDWPKVSIIVHAYNQADNISSTLLSVLGQQYPQFEIIFTDLGSTDNTLKIAKSFQDPRLKTVSTKPIKPGWTLNAWVSQQLLDKCTGDIVVLLSADTILLPNALSILTSLVKNEKLSLVSVLAADQNKSLSQQIILSQNHFFMLGMYPSAWLANKMPNSANVSGNIIAFNRASIDALGGFELVAKSPLEDFDLAASISSRGLKTGFFIGSDIATNQNHLSLKSIIAQNLRRYYPALHFSMPLSLSLLSGGFVVLILPSLLVMYLLVVGFYTGLIMIALAIGLSYINRLIITISSKQSVLSTLLYPVGSIVCFALMIYSMLNYEVLKPRWQKRTEAF